MVDGVGFIISLVLFFFMVSCSLCDYESPSITIEGPIEGDVVHSSFLIWGSAKDNIGVKSVHFSLQGQEWEVLDGVEKWHKLIYIANTGEHTLTVKAYDYNENIAVAQVTVDVQ